MNILKIISLIIAAILVIGLVILFPYIVNISFMGWTKGWTTRISIGSTDSWIGFSASYFGAIFGGVIGGLFTYLGVRQTLNSQYKQKFIDEFPGHIKSITVETYEFKNQMDYFLKLEYFIKGYAQFIKAREFFGQVQHRTSQATETGTKVDGALYDKMKELRNRSDTFITKFNDHPLIDQTVADDEYGTNQRLTEETIELRKQAIEELKPLYTDFINVFETQQNKMEKKFKAFIKS